MGIFWFGEQNKAWQTRGMKKVSVRGLRDHSRQVWHLVHGGRTAKPSRPGGSCGEGPRRDLLSMGRGPQVPRERLMQKNLIKPVPGISLLLIILGFFDPAQLNAAAKDSKPQVLQIVEAKKIAQDLKKAQGALRKGELGALQEGLEAALQRVRDQAPLQMERLTVIDAAPQGLGMLHPSPRAVVRDNRLLLYVELRNFVSHKVGQGWDVDLTTDAAFYYADGSLIARKDKIGRHHFVASTRHDVTFMVVELTLRGMPAQDYQVELFVRDQHSGKTASLKGPFTVVSEEKK